MKEDLLPLIPIFTNREKLTSFVLQNPNEVLRFGSLFIPSLIIAKLEGGRELEKLAEFLLNNRINAYYNLDQHSEKLLNDFVAFANLH